MNKRLFTGLQPSGPLHIGNYFGAMRQLVDNQYHFDTFAMIADYHALNFVQNKSQMKENIVNLTMDYLAVGLDPKKVTVFQQSDISEHTELTWIFDAITTMPYLMRGHAFKDAEAKNKEVSVGKFNYPMLMASDILLYDTDVVPVGKDQKQHIEITRDTADKFNRIFKEDLFKLPEALIIEKVATVPGIDGQKMSKSYNNTISLFASDDEIKEKVLAIVTDSSNDLPKNVYAIHALLKDKRELDEIYDSKRGRYKEIKELLIEDLIDFISPLREKRKEISNDLSFVLEILEDGKGRAKIIASKKMDRVKELVGVKI